MFPMFDAIVGPIGSDSCLYFYVIAVLSFILLVLSLLGLLINLLRKPKSFTLTSLIIPLNAGLMYFVNRVLYNMCVGSL